MFQRVGVLLVTDQWVVFIRIEDLRVRFCGDLSHDSKVNYKSNGIWRLYSDFKT